MPESNTKRIFAEVSIETRDQFLAKARLEGTTGQALIETWVSEYLEGHRKTTPDADRRWIDKLVFILEPGALTPPQTLTPQAHEIDMHTHVCDPNGVHVEDSQT